MARFNDRTKCDEDSVRNMTEEEFLNMFTSALNLDQVPENTQFVDSLLNARKRNMSFRFDLNKMIMIVAATDRLDILTILLNMKGSIANTVDARGKQPIHHAAENGHPENIKLLVKHRALVYCSDSEGKTPLHLACLRGQTDAVRVLVKFGARINSCRTHAGDSAVHLTASAGHCKVMKVLLENDGDVNSISEYSNGGQTPLHKAIAANMPDMVRFLLEYGGNMKIPNAEFKFPIHLACELGHTSCLRVLIESGAFLEVKDSRGLTALHITVLENQPAAARMLLSHKANMYVLDQHGRSLLHAASIKDNTVLLEIFVRAGLDVDVQDLTTLRSPLMSSIATGSLSVIKKLIELGADVNLPDNNQSTPLHQVHHQYGRHSSRDLTEILLNAGARLDLQDQNKQTPLRRCLEMMILARKQNMDCTKLLVEAGSHLGPDTANNLQRSPLFRLSFTGYLREAFYLAQAGWDLNLENWLTLPGRDARQDRLHHMLIEMRRNPTSLLCTCRKFIRTTFYRKRRHREILSSIAVLPLPNPIKKFLSLRDIELVEDSVFDPPAAPAAR